MRLTRHALGREAERVVAEYLVNDGFVLLAKNLRLGALEIDLLAKKGGLVALVEVRARGAGSFQSSLASIGPKKRATLLRAAERVWRERLSSMPDVERMRIDVAAVTFDGGAATIDYVPAAIVDGMR